MRTWASYVNSVTFIFVIWKMDMVKVSWKMGIKFVKHFIWNMYSVHSDFTVRVLCECVWTSGWCVLAKYYVNSYWESLLQGKDTSYQVVWKSVCVHTWVSRKDIVKPFFDDCLWVITWYKAITLKSHYKTAHGIGCKGGAWTLAKVVKCWEY